MFASPRHWHRKERRNDLGHGKSLASRPDEAGRGRTRPRAAAAENSCRVTATVDSTLRGKKTRSCGTPLPICRRRTRQTAICPCGARRSAFGMSPTTPTQGATESRTASDRAAPPVAPTAPADEVPSSEVPSCQCETGRTCEQFGERSSSRDSQLGIVYLS